MKWPLLTFPPINLWSVWTMREIESPCTGMCYYDLRPGICVKCGRTLEEIGGWNQYTKDYQRDIIERAKKRMDELAKSR